MQNYWLSLSFTESVRYRRRYYRLPNTDLTALITPARIASRILYSRISYNKSCLQIMKQLRGFSSRTLSDSTYLSSVSSPLYSHCIIQSCINELYGSEFKFYLTNFHFFVCWLHKAMSHRILSSTSRGGSVVCNLFHFPWIAKKFYHCSMQRGWHYAYWELQHYGVCNCGRIVRLDRMLQLNLFDGRIVTSTIRNAELCCYFLPFHTHKNNHKHRYFATSLYFLYKINEYLCYVLKFTACQAEITSRPRLKFCPLSLVKPNLSTPWL